MWTHNHPPSTTTASESFRHQRTANSPAPACAPAPVLLLPNPISQLMVLCTPSEGTLLFPLHPPSTVSVKHAVPNKTISPPTPFHFQIHLLPPKRSSFQDINFPCMNFSHCQSVHGWKGVWGKECSLERVSHHSSFSALFKQICIRTNNPPLPPRTLTI